MSAPNLIEFHCPNCKVQICVPVTGANSVMECPGCELRITVPPESLLASYPASSEAELDRADSGYGLEPVTDDLLSPKSEQSSDQIPLLEILDSDPHGIRPSHLSPDSDSPKPTSSRSRRETPPGVEDQSKEKRSTGSRWRGEPDSAKQKQDSPKVLSDLPVDLFAKFDIGAFVKAALTMIASPGLLWRAAVSSLLMGAGRGIMHHINRTYVAHTHTGTATVADWLLNTLVWFGFGGIPYMVGTLLLWSICGCVFRATVMGGRQVGSWQFKSAADIFNTSLIFAFPFFVAGIPVGIFPLLGTPFAILMAPFRFLVSVPLLLSAWHNQSPFHVVSLDVFKHFERDRARWKTFYQYVFCLAGLSLFAGFLMSVSLFILSLITSTIGALLIATLTLSFAALAGWHCEGVLLGIENDDCSR